MILFEFLLVQMWLVFNSLSLFALPLRLYTPAQFDWAPEAMG